jgi:hypothetical protein
MTYLLIQMHADILCSKADDLLMNFRGMRFSALQKAAHRKFCRLMHFQAGLYRSGEQVMHAANNNWSKHPEVHVPGLIWLIKFAQIEYTLVVRCSSWHANVNVSLLEDVPRIQDGGTQGGR